MEEDPSSCPRMGSSRSSNKKVQSSTALYEGGPNFYHVQDVRLGRRFAYSVVRAVREGRLLYRDASRLDS